MNLISKNLRRCVLLTSLAFLLAACNSAAGQTSTTRTSLSLHDAIQFSQSSPQAHEAQDLVDAARGSVLQAGLRPNPRLYLQSEDLRPWADNFDFPNATEDYAYLGQLFELGGKRARRLDVARANVRQADNRTSSETSRSPAVSPPPTGRQSRASASPAARRRSTGCRRDRALQQGTGRRRCHARRGPDPRAD